MQPNREGSRTCWGCALVLLAVLFGAAAMGARAGNTGVTVVFGILGAFALCAVIGLGMVARREGAIRYGVEVDPARARLNETVRVSVRLEAQRPCRVTTGAVTLLCRERAISRGGTSDTTYYHTVHEDMQPFEIHDTLTDLCPWATTLTFVIPEGLPASFAGRNNFIEWQIRLHVGLRGMLDVRHEQPFTVLNEAA